MLLVKLITNYANNETDIEITKNSRKRYYNNVTNSSLNRLFSIQTWVLTHIMSAGGYLSSEYELVDPVEIEIEYDRNE